jgi:membrane protease YdiL (CAAX protease family)
LGLECSLIDNISPYSILFAVYAIDFSLISSFFHYKTLLKRYKDDFKAFILYFFYFFLLLLVIPVLSIIFSFARPIETLKKLGLQFGNYKLGILVILIGIPIIAILVYISTKDPKLKEQYPFSKIACQNLKKFILYEISYLLFYYLAWEFTFRGAFLFSLSELMGYSNTGIMVAILTQSIIATIYHLGHPSIEIFGALLGSIIFGVVAYFTKSIFYSLVIHALLGILNDTVFYLRFHKRV